MRRVFFVHAVKRQLHFIADGKPVFPREFFGNKTYRRTVFEVFRGKRPPLPHIHRAVVKARQQRRICNRQNGRGRVPHGKRLRKLQPILPTLGLVKACRHFVKCPCLPIAYKQISACVALCGALRRDQCVFNGAFRVFVVIDDHICIRHICFPCLQWRGIFRPVVANVNFVFVVLIFRFRIQKSLHIHFYGVIRHRRFGRREFDHRVKQRRAAVAHRKPLQIRKVIRAFFRRFQIIRAVKIQNIGRDHRIIHGFGFAIIRPIGGIPPRAHLRAVRLLLYRAKRCELLFHSIHLRLRLCPQICPQHQKRRGGGHQEEE